MSRYLGGIETETFSLCPSHRGFESGTFVIGAYCYQSKLFNVGRNCDINLTVTLLPLPQPYTPPSALNTSLRCVVPPSLAATHTCIQDDQVWEANNVALEAADITYLMFVLPPKRRLYIHSNVAGLYLSATEPRPIVKGMIEADWTYPAPYPWIDWQSAPWSDLLSSLSSRSASFTSSSQVEESRRSLL